MPWFLSAFQNFHFKPNLRLRFYDTYLAFGTRALFSFGLTIVAIERKRLATGNLDLVMTILQKPHGRLAFKDWRKVLAVYQDMFITSTQYSSYFRRAGITEFP
jgi:hypothetical protein